MHNPRNLRTSCLSLGNGLSRIAEIISGSTETLSPNSKTISHLPEEISLPRVKYQVGLSQFLEDMLQISHMAIYGLLRYNCVIQIYDKSPKKSSMYNLYQSFQSCRCITGNCKLARSKTRSNRDGSLITVNGSEADSTFKIQC